MAAQVPPPGQFTADLPSGAPFHVFTDREKQYLEERVKSYTDQLQFSNISDRQELDRLISYELLAYRWSLWLSMNQDYWGTPINGNDLQKHSKEISAEIRLIKKNLGIDKSSRDKQRSQEAVEEYILNLLHRAKAFSYKRNKEFYQVITSFHRIKGALEFHDNADEFERKAFKIEVEDVIEILREEIAAFEAIDEEFRSTEQKTWIRDL